jgi:signal peptide peptidase SppA
MRLQHIAEQIYHQPWLITSTGHRSVQNLFESKLAKACQFEASDDGEEYDSPFIVQRGKPSLDANGIGRVYIKGVIGQGLSRIEKSCGNTDTKDVTVEIKALVEQGAKALFICVDSPGGMITGTPELADFISNVAAEIPVYIFCDSQLCSAAYWFAAGVTKILSTDSAEIGSIGVYFPWIDQSALWDKQGIKSDPIVNEGGVYKGIGLGPSLTPEQREELQAKVNRVFGLFKTFVTTMRALNGAVVPDTACQGQTFFGIDAFSSGLVDQIVSCEAEAYDALVEAMENETELDETADLPDDVFR